MSRHPGPVASLLAILFVSALASASATSAQKPAEQAKQQLEFGVEMAQRGLWSEALFRFKQALRHDTANPSIYNNMAVAYEALGQFELALENYRKGLELEPSNRGLKRNYARFVEFYQRFKPPEEGEEGEEGEAGAGTTEETESGSESPESETSAPS